MYTHFTIKPTVTYPMKTPGVWTNLSREVEGTLKRFEFFHHNSTAAVQSDHPLVRLITHMNVPYTLSPERYYFNVLENYQSVAEALGFGTGRLSFNSGKYSRRGKLYRDSVIEIGLAYDTTLIAETESINWKKLTPVTILAHHSVSVNPKVLVEADYAQTMPYVIYSVNVPLLMLQFRAWQNNEIANGVGNQRTVEQFVRMYPIPNATRSHVNLALINAVTRMKEGETVRVVQQDKANLGIYIVNSTPLLVDYAAQLKKSLLSVPLAFNGVMANLLTLNGTAIDSFGLPPLTPMSQTCWPLSLAALHHWKILADLCGSNLMRMNSTTIALLKREFKVFSTEAMWEQHLPKEVAAIVIADKNELFERLK